MDYHNIKFKGDYLFIMVFWTSFPDCFEITLVYNIIFLVSYTYYIYIYVFRIIFFHFEGYAYTLHAHGLNKENLPY